MNQSRVGEAARDAKRIVESVASVVRGKEAQAELAVTALLAGGISSLKTPLGLERPRLPGRSPSASASPFDAFSLPRT